MKKKFTISAALSLITFFGFAQCPSYFTRNNGNGTCGAEAQIKMYFPSCPVTAPKIDSIYVGGVKANITVFPPDTSKCSVQGYVSYCFSGNLPPVSSIKVFFDFDVTDTITTACDVSNGPAAGPTPVVLSSFDAERTTASSVAVNWKTEQEFNASGVEIQRSSDNINFVAVGFVSSKNANSSIAQYYSFTDNSNSAKGTTFYRIKMVDLDNTFAFSSIKAVKGTGFQAEVNVFPNPASSNSKITIGNLSESTSVRVFDNTGRLIQQISSTNSSSLELNHLQKGSYFIKIIGLETGASTVKKLSIIN
jgi:hypothetical protein